MRAKLFASQDARLTFPAKGSAHLQPSPSTRTFQTIQPPRGKDGNDFLGCAVLLMGELTSLMVKQQLVGAPSPSQPMESDEVIHIKINKYIYIMFGPVITTEAHLAYAGARLHTNNTELSSIIEAVTFLAPIGPVARDSQAWIFHDSKHAANMCLGMIQSRTNVPLGLTSQ